MISLLLLRHMRRMAFSAAGDKNNMMEQAVEGEYPDFAVRPEVLLRAFRLWHCTPRASKKTKPSTAKTMSTTR